MQSENRNIDELKSGFETFYQSRILPIMQDMEKVRQKYLRYFILACCLAIVAIPLLMCGIFYFQLGASIAEQNSSSFADSAIYGLVVLIITICATPIALYKKKAKSKIMPIMLQYFEGFNYQYKKTISSVNINDTRLIGFYDGREGDDYFEGVYKNVPIKVSEEKFTQRKLVYRNKKPHYENVEVFHGVLILLDMNKNFSGQTVVLQDKGFLNVFSKVSRDLKGLSNVKLEDSVFEKKSLKFLHLTKWKRAICSPLLLWKECLNSAPLIMPTKSNLVFSTISFLLHLKQTEICLKRPLCSKHA